MTKELAHKLASEYIEILSEQYPINNEMREYIKEAFVQGIFYAENRYLKRLKGKINVLHNYLTAVLYNLDYNLFNVGELAVNNENQALYRIIKVKRDSYIVHKYNKNVVDKEGEDIEISKEELETNYHRVLSYVGDEL